MKPRASRVPTLRLALVLVGAAGLSLAAGALLPEPAARGLELSVLAVALLGAAADAAFAPRGAELRVGRSVSGPLRTGRPASVVVGFRWEPRRASRARRFWWTDGPPPSLTPRAPEGRARITAGRTLTVGYEVRPGRRGKVRWTGPRFTVDAPLGLWRTRVDATLLLERTVYPAGAPLVGTNGAAAAGDRPAPYEGGMDFDGVRPYLPGEDARLMDWRATARWDQPVVRRLRPERGRRLMLVVDAGCRSAQVPDEDPFGPDRLDILCDAAMAVAQTALRTGDAVGAMLLRSAGAPAMLPPREGRPALHRVAELLAGARPSAGETDPAEAVVMLLRLPCDAVLWFGEAPDPLAAADLLRYLPHLARRRPVTFLEVAPSLGEPADDGERAVLLREAAREAAGERRTVLRALARGGVAGLDARSHNLTASALTAYLRWAQRGVAG